MNIGVIGVGGVGGYFGGKLARLAEQNVAENLKVYFVARNQHLEEIKKHGLVLSTVDEGEIICKPVLATDDLHELPVLDVCLVCVKSFDLSQGLQGLRAKITDDTLIVPLLNGVDIYERIRAEIPNGVVYPSCVYIGTHIDKPGKVVQNGGSCMILLGPDPQNASVLPEKLLELFELAGIKYRWCENIVEEIWSKYIFIAAFGMVTASENKTFGQILEDEVLSGCVKRILQEIADIAQKRGVSLPGDIVEDSFHKAKNFPYETKTSFQRDFELDKLNERELFVDTIMRLGEDSGVKTRNIEMVYEKLKSLK